MAPIKSTSKPSATVPFMDSIGGNVVSEPTTSLPGFTSVNSVAATLVVVPAGGTVVVDSTTAVVVVVPPQPANTLAPTTNTTTARAASHRPALRMISSSLVTKPVDPHPPVGAPYAYCITNVGPLETGNTRLPAGDQLLSSARAARRSRHFHTAAATSASASRAHTTQLKRVKYP